MGEYRIYTIRNDGHVSSLADVIEAESLDQWHSKKPTNLLMVGFLRSGMKGDLSLASFAVH